MTMMGQAQQTYLEAAVAQHRESLIRDMNRSRAVRPGRASWVQGLIDGLSGKHPGARRGAIRWDGDGPVTRPAASPHHATSH